MNVAVTGLNATDNPGPGVPVIRCLSERLGADDRIIGLIYDTLEPGVYMENITARNYLIPYPSHGLDAMFERLQYIHEREQLDVMIPTLDTELYVFYKLESRLRDIGIRMFVPDTSQLTMRGKDRLASFCKTHDIKTPRTEIVNSLGELQTVVADVGFPCVVKGIFYDAYICNSLDEAIAALRRVAAKWGLPIIVQERLTGDEFNVAALGDGAGRTVGAVAMRKLYITDKGKGWAGVSIYDPALSELSRRVIAALNWKGGLELEFMKNRQSKEYSLLEINPRFPAWVYLAAAAGQNLPAAAVDLARGKSVESMDTYKVGTVFVRSSWDLITDMKRIEMLTTDGEIGPL